MMTLQQVFDTAVRNCLTRVQEGCVFEDEGVEPDWPKSTKGILQCPVASLIPPELYAPSLRSYTVRKLFELNVEYFHPNRFTEPIKSFMEACGIPQEAKELCHQLAWNFDHYTPERWAQRFRLVAERFNLDASVIDKF